MNPMHTRSITSRARLLACLALSALLTGCTSKEGEDATGPGNGASTGGGSTGGPDHGATSTPTTGNPCTSSGPSSCQDATGSCTATDEGGEGGLITTGNEQAVEWDVTVRHTFSGRPPEEGTYLATTLVELDDAFSSVVAIPSEGGVTYGYFDGTYADGVATITSDGDMFFGVSVEGTLYVTDSTLEGSGTFSDADTDALMGTWEILSATSHP